MSWSRDCKYCGKAGLHWETIDGRWKLFDSRNKPHTCDIKSEQKIKSIPPKQIINLKNDPMIKKALVKFKKQLEKESL